MSSKIVKYYFDVEPVIEVLLENLHDESIPPYRFQALIDTGSATTLVPRSICKHLGHVFEKGSVMRTAGGIGNGVIRTFVHATRLTVLQPNDAGILTGTLQPIFEPIDFHFEYIEQNIPFVLLGQLDFLRYFQYTQNADAGWFSLERIK